MREVHNNGGEQGNMFLYIVVTAWVFVISLAILNVFGLVPYYIDGTPSNATIKAALARDANQEERSLEDLRTDITEENVPEPVIIPTRLVIPVIDVDLPVSNPNTTDIDELDNELLTAVVRYPGSGTLGVDGNMLIFGHSSGLRTVHNQMFKAFNDLKNLEQGNVIKLISGDMEYIYTVNAIIHEDASNVTVEFVTEPGVKKLTLTTCDSFGKKSDRYIVSADFVSSYSTATYQPTTQ